MMRRAILLGLLLTGPIGCHQAVIDSADRQVYEVIQDRQTAALGTTSDVHVGPEDGELGATDRMYQFVPRPASEELPASFATSLDAVGAPDEASGDSGADQPGDVNDEAAASEPAEDRTIIDENQPVPDEEPEPLQTKSEPERLYDGSPPAEEEIEEGESETVEPAEEPFDFITEEELLSESIFTEDQLPFVSVFGLSDAVAYALRNARELRDAKEDLYLAALDLTLERHLWTPQFVADLSAEYANYGQVRDFDQAMTAVSQVAVYQRLPYGGEVTAKMVNVLMRDLGEHITTGESGNIILDANIPLFRGAGRVAYESRYRRERELIYAVRAYERFRRTFVVDIAADYFTLQQLKATVSNSHKSYVNRLADWERAEYYSRTVKARSVFDAPRAKSAFRSAESALVSTKEGFESTLDRFKIRIGMSVEELLDVVDQADDVESESVELLLPEVDLEQAIDVALYYRLDLLTSADQIDDAKRGVVIAKNNILPDLDFTGSVTLDTDPNQKNSMTYNTERATWRGLLQLSVDDRKSERNAYRGSIIDLRRTERRHDQFTDTVRADVRRAVRIIGQQADLRVIQQLNVEENEFRADAARMRFRLGDATNQDVVDAEDDLFAARNQLAGAIASYREAILGFRLATGTLRVTDEGKWAVELAPGAAADEADRKATSP
jgi:outer membrane protein TolC